MSTGTVHSKFTHLAIDQFVVVQGGADQAISGRIISVTARTLEVALSIRGSRGHSLECGAEVHVVDDHGRSVEARVVRVSDGPAPLLTLRPIVADDGETRQKQREHRRVMGNGVPAYLSLVRIGRAARYRVEIIDLSAGGARLRCLQTLDGGENVQVHFPAIGGAHAWNGNGHIVWARPDDSGWLAGLQFIDLTAADREAIQRIVFQMRWQKEPAGARG